MLRDILIKESSIVRMRTTEERITLMHQKAEEMQEKKENTLLHVWGTVSAFMFLCLLSLMTMFCRTGHGLAEATITASSLLSDSAGGYVLTAVAFFMVGVLATIIFKRK